MVESYIQALITSAGVIMGAWGFVKVLRDIKKSNDEEVKRRERVDKVVKIVEEKADKWDKGLSDIYGERETIVKRFDERLDEVDRKIDDVHTDEEAKIQELRADVLILTKCMAAVLDGLKQLNCNGRVSEAKQDLDEFLMNRAYDQ